MGIINAVRAGLDKLDTKTEDIQHSSYTGSRFVLLLVLVAGLFWVTKGVFTEHTITLCFWAYVTYVASNTVTRGLQIWGNAKLKMRQSELVWKDGHVSAEERQVLAETEKA